MVLKVDDLFILVSEIKFVVPMQQVHYSEIVYLGCVGHILDARTETQFMYQSEHEPGIVTPANVADQPAILLAIYYRKEYFDAELAMKDSIFCLLIAICAVVIKIL